MKICHQENIYLKTTKEKRIWVLERSRDLCMAGVGGTRINTMVNEQFHQT